MFVVHIHNAQDAVAIDEPFLREVAAHALRSENVDEADISVAIVDDAAIQELNRRFLDHDEPTDVLSFSLDGDEPVASSQGFDKSLGTSQKRIDGEIVLSAETARRRAGDFGWSPRDEIVLYLVHGLLHLAGHDDQTPEDRIAMRTRERAVLARWGLSPRYDEDRPASGLQGEPPDPSFQFSIFNSQFSISAPNATSRSRRKLKTENCQLKNEDLIGPALDNPRPSSTGDEP